MSNTEILPNTLVVSNKSLRKLLISNHFHIPENSSVIYSFDNFHIGWKFELPQWSIGSSFH